MIGCLYRPPNSSVKFWSSLEDALGSLDGYEVILMGDLNVDFSDQRDKNYVHMKHVCLSLNLRNLISSPTRITAATAKTLDVVLTNIEQCLITGGILYSKKFSSAKNFVKSDRQAVRQEFIFVKHRVALVFGRSVRLLIVYLHIHDYF